MGESLIAWEQRLLAAEADLSQREEQAAADEHPSVGLLLALAAERDKIAGDRDELADAYDERAAHRDLSALGRDSRSSQRDVAARAAADDADEGFPDRWVSAVDRDDAAGDRADSLADRQRGAQARTHARSSRERAAQDRETAAGELAAYEREVENLREALESRLVIGQAQGLLMAWHGITTDEAFAALVRLSQDANSKLRLVAASIVAGADRKPR